MCLPNIMNLLCISHCCHQYFCDFYPLHHFTHWCQLLGTLSVTSSLSSSVFIHVLPRCHSGSARIFTFLLRHLMALYSIGQEFQFLLRVQGNNFICNDFLCWFFLCAAALSWYCPCEISLSLLCWVLAANTSQLFVKIQFRASNSTFYFGNYVMLCYHRFHNWWYY